MLHIGKTERSYSIAFLLFYLFAAVMNILMQFTVHLTGLSAVLYCFFIIAWGASVYLRIVHKRIRRDVIAIAAFLFGLFIVRLSRYILFEHSLTIDRYMWYLYYIPYIALPMDSLVPDDGFSVNSADLVLSSSVEDDMQRITLLYRGTLY